MGRCLVCWQLLLFISLFISFIHAYMFIDSEYFDIVALEPSSGQGSIYELNADSEIVQKESKPIGFIYPPVASIVIQE